MERIKQKLDVARKQREQLQNGYTASAESVGHRERSAFMSEKNRFMALKGNHTKLLLGVVVIIMSTMAIWWGVSSNEHDVIQLSDIEMIESRQAGATESTAVEKMEMKIAALAEQVDSLIESINQLETKLISTHLTTDSIIAAKAIQPPTTSTTQHTIAKAEPTLEMLPPPASEITEKETSVAIAPLLSSDRVTSDSSTTLTATENQPPISHKQSTATVSKNAPWVINLVSTSSKVDADRLAKKALSKSIQTEQQQITVKGTQYWRVQITGFSTADDARAYADTAKKQLGLKDAWIMKR